MQKLFKGSVHPFHKNVLFLVLSSYHVDLVISKTFGYLSLKPLLSK